MACRFCDNAFTNPNLTIYNDLSYCSVGFSEKGYALYIRSGHCRSTSLVVTRFGAGLGLNQDVAFYSMKYCPECGRRLFENDNYR